MTREINITGPINQLGYGIATLNIAYEMARISRVALHTIGPPSDVPLSMGEAIGECIRNAGFYNPEAPSLRIWHENEQASYPTRGRRYGFPFFEVHPLPLNVCHHLSQLDGIIVSSKWAKEVVLNDLGVDDGMVNAVPLGVDRSIFWHGLEASTFTPDHTVFINIGKWEVRKGHDFLLSCFNKAFNRSDKVMLKMFTFNPFIGGKNNEWRVKYLTSKMGMNMHIPFERLATQHDIAREIASSDVGIFPYRAEGWNLDLLECLAMGKHCIATNYSAPTEYINTGNCHLIHVDQMESANDGFWFHGQGQWAHLGSDQEDQCIEHMRNLHRMKQSGALTANVEGIDTGRSFSWECTAHALSNIILE